MVLFLGAGQIGPVVKRISRLAGEGVVVVQGVPHWYAHNSGDDIEEFCAEYVRQVMANISQSHTQIRLVAESQAAPGVLMYTDDHADQVASLTLVRPLGYTAKYFGNDKDERFKEFQRRASLTFRQLIPFLLRYPPALIVPYAVFAARMRESARSYASKYGMGCSYDATDITRSVVHQLAARGASFTIMLAEDDRLFPPKETLTTLRDAQLLEHITTVIEPDRFHISLAASRDSSEINRILSIARNTTNNIG